MNDRITIDPAVLVGKPIIKGTRLAVEFIVGLLAGGWTFNEILQEYDYISHEDIQACLAYAHQLLSDEKVFHHCLPPFVAFANWASAIAIALHEMTNGIAVVSRCRG